MPNNSRPNSFDNDGEIKNSLAEIEKAIKKADTLINKKIGALAADETLALLEKKRILRDALDAVDKIQKNPKIDELFSDYSIEKIKENENLQKKPKDILAQYYDIANNAHKKIQEIITQPEAESAKNKNSFFSNILDAYQKKETPQKDITDTNTATHEIRPRPPKRP